MLKQHLCRFFPQQCHTHEHNNPLILSCHLDFCCIYTTGLEFRCCADKTVAGVTTSLWGFKASLPFSFLLDPTQMAKHESVLPWKMEKAGERRKSRDFYCWISDKVWSTADLFLPDQHLQILLSLHWLQTSLGHTHTQRNKPVGAEEKKKGGQPADFSGNMSTETITFVTTKFNYSLNSLWSRPLPLIEALTCGPTKTRLQQAQFWIKPLNNSAQCATAFGKSLSDALIMRKMYDFSNRRCWKTNSNG